MRSTYKRFVWRAPRPVNTADCMNEWRYCLKCNKNISILTHFQQYLHSFIQSAMFTGRVARQTNRLYVLRMTAKLAYCCVLLLYLLLLLLLFLLLLLVLVLLVFFVLLLLLLVIPLLLVLVLLVLLLPLVLFVLVLLVFRVVIVVVVLLLLFPNESLHLSICLHQVNDHWY